MLLFLGGILRQKNQRNSLDFRETEEQSYSVLAAVQLGMFGF